MLNLFVGLDIYTGLLLLLALAFVLFYEAINGFHDTANAVATVIYTRAMQPQLAVVMAAFFNFFGVLLGGLSVAYAIVHMLPTDLLLNMGSTHGLAMVFSMLLAAIIWNLGTWFFGLPASSSHTLIGAIIGIGLTNALLTGSSVMDALNLREVTKIFSSLIVSPIVGLVIAGGLIFLLRRFGEGLPTAEAFWKGAVYALVIAFCWALGVWAAVGPEPSDDDGRQDGEAVGNVGSRAAWRGRVLCFVLLLGAFALVCSSQISEMLGGECSLARGFGGILLKAMAVAAVVVPVWLDSRRSKW